MNIVEKLIGSMEPVQEASPVEERHAWRKRAEEDRRARRPRLLLDRMGWPERAVHVASSADDSKPCVRAVASFSPGGMLVLSGGAGVGKTVAAAWWALRQVGVVEFVTAERFVTASAFGERDRWIHAPALVLDDLGVEYQDVKGAAASAIDGLINEFYANRRTLIVTTNLEVAEFKARVGRRVEDRVRECDAWREFANAPSLRSGRR